jgi:cytochrome d ubiquinol oxidase subunit I
MQHPVGYRYDKASGRAELTDFGAVLSNKVVLVTFPHTILAAYMVGGGFIAAVGLWHLIRRPGQDRDAFRTATRFGAVTLIVAGVGVAISGDIQGKVMTEVQPMKMAAAEALYSTDQPASFSLFTIGTLNGSKEVFALKVPRVLSFLATGHLDGQVQGINNLQSQYEKTYGPGDYSPNIPVTYWAFRLMVGVGALAALIGLWTLWTLRRGRLPTSRWLLASGLALPILPLLGNSFGWIFTEMGRQPWIVFGLMHTAAGVSPGTTSGEVLTSLLVFTSLYGALAVVEVGLLIRFIRVGLPDLSGDEGPDDADSPLAFAY